jgi:small subunit ribosomal protein S21
LFKEVFDLATVIVGDSESFEKAMKRFKKVVEREGILTELKRREFYEKPSQKRKRKERAAKKRLMKAIKKKRVAL